MSNAASAATAVPLSGPATPDPVASNPPAGAASTPSVSIVDIYRQRAVASLTPESPASSTPASTAAPGSLPAAPANPSNLPNPTPSAGPATDPTAPTAPSDEPGAAFEQAPTLPQGVREALSTLRADRRTLKATNEALQARLADLEARLAPAASAPGTAGQPAPGVQTPGLPANHAVLGTPPVPDAPAATPLEQARQAVQQEEQNITAINALLNRARRGDTDGVMQTLRDNQLPLPPDPADLPVWLESVKEQYVQRRVDAQVESRMLEARIADQTTSIRRQAQAYAAERMPELAQPNSARAQMAQRLMQAHPSLASDPMGSALLVNAILGMELAGQRPAATPANATPPAVVVIPASRQGGAGAPSPSVLPGAPAATYGAPAEPSASELFKRYQQTGSDSDKAAYQAALARAINRPANARG